MKKIATSLSFFLTLFLLCGVYSHAGASDMYSLAITSPLAGDTLVNSPQNPIATITWTSTGPSYDDVIILLADDAGNYIKLLGNPDGNPNTGSFVWQYDPSLLSGKRYIYIHETYATTPSSPIIRSGEFTLNSTVVPGSATTPPLPNLPPSIDSVSPSNATPGTMVTLKGKGFADSGQPMSIYLASSNILFQRIYLAGTVTAAASPSGQIIDNNTLTFVVPSVVDHCSAGFGDSCIHEKIPLPADNYGLTVTYIAPSGVGFTSNSQNLAVAVPSVTPPGTGGNQQGTTTPPVTSVKPTLTCTPSNLTPKQGDSVKWTAQMSDNSPLTGYRFTWSGSGVSGSGNPKTKAFTKKAVIGEKDATVTATKRNMPTFTASCSLNLQSKDSVTTTGTTTPLAILQSVSCSGKVQGSKKILWTATTTPSDDGKSGFAYTWSGTGGVTGTKASTATGSYASAGNKTARVTVVQGRKRVSASCGVVKAVAEVTPSSLTASIYNSLSSFWGW